MSRWLIKADINDPYRPYPTSSESYEKSSDQAEEIKPNKFEEDENAWKETFNENRNTDGVIGAKENGRESFITIFDGHK